MGQNRIVQHTRSTPGTTWAVALLVLLALPVAPGSPGAAALGRLLRQANFQEKAGCLHYAMQPHSAFSSQLSKHAAHLGSKCQGCTATSIGLSVIRMEAGGRETHLLPR